MITVVTCNQCGKSGSIPITLSVSEWATRCKTCKEQKQKIREYRFCSYKCCRKYAKKLENHNCEKYYYATFGISDRHHKIKEVGVTCGICYKSSKVNLPTQLKIHNLDIYTKSWGREQKRF